MYNYLQEQTKKNIIEENKKKGVLVDFYTLRLCLGGKTNLG